MLGEENKGYRLSMRILIVLIGFTAVFCIMPSRNPVLSKLEAEEQEFSLFVRYFNKDYSADEVMSRFQKFKNNLEYIHRHNLRESSVVLGVNQFADMDFSEFSSIYLFKEEPVLNAPPSDPIQISLDPDSIDPLPSSVDWVSQNRVTKVKNQGKCGSCYTFASTGAIESAWAINQSLSSDLPLFSEQQLMDCSENEGCNGGYAWLCFKYVVSNGLNTEANYPYKAVDQSCNKTQEENKDVSIKSYQNVTAFNYLALMRAVTIQPVATSVEANMEWMLYKSGIMTNNCGIALNHAVLITGYDTTGVPNWTIKNSWGTAWGNSGYIQLGLSAGVGVCGINTRPVYPII
jgi:C1A family cysteine protease